MTTVYPSVVRRSSEPPGSMKWESEQEYSGDLVGDPIFVSLLATIKSLFLVLFLFVSLLLSAHHIRQY